MNPDWEYKLWTDEDLHELVQDHYPELEELYLSYPNPVQRADMGRYLVLDHCGGADPAAFFPKKKKTPKEPKHDKNQWYKEMERLAQRTNIICKLSGIVDNVGNYPLIAADLAPIINHCLEIFGPDRVIFAGDWPVCLRNMSLAQWIETLKEVVASRSLADQRKLFYDNASTFYRV